MAKKKEGRAQKRRTFSFPYSSHVLQQGAIWGGGRGVQSQSGVDEPVQRRWKEKVGKVGESRCGCKRGAKKEGGKERKGTRAATRRQERRKSSPAPGPGSREALFPWPTWGAAKTHPRAPRDTPAVHAAHTTHHPTTRRGGPRDVRRWKKRLGPGARGAAPLQASWIEHGAVSFSARACGPRGGAPTSQTLWKGSAGTQEHVGQAGARNKQGRGCEILGGMALCVRCACGEESPQKWGAEARSRGRGLFETTLDTAVAHALGIFFSHVLRTPRGWLYVGGGMHSTQALGKVNEEQEDHFDFSACISVKHQPLARRTPAAEIQ